MGSQIQTFSGCYPGPGSSGSPVIQARWDTWSFLVSSGSSLGSPPSWMCLWGVFKGKIKRVYKSKCVSRCWEAPLHMWKQFYKAFSPEGGLWYQPTSMGLNQAQAWQVSRTLHCVGPPLVRAGMVIGCPSTHTAGKEADFGMLNPGCKKVLGMSSNSKRFMTGVWRIRGEWFFFFKAFEQNKTQVRK